MLRAQRWLGFALTVLMAILPVAIMQTPAAAAGAACPTTAYLPNTNVYPTDPAASLVGSVYLQSGNLFYKVNKNSGEAIVVGYDRTFTGSIDVPEDLAITGTEIAAAGFDSGTADCQAFAKSYKVRYIGPAAFSTVWGRTAPVLERVTFQANLKVIGREAFIGQCRIESLVIPDSVTDIGKSAFSGMDSGASGAANTNCSTAANHGLKTVTFGVNLQRFYDNVLSYSQRLTSISFRGPLLSSSPAGYPADYERWNVGNYNTLTALTPNNTCAVNFNYVYNLSVRVLANSLNDWTPWALANNCFSQAQVNTFVADITTPPSKPAAPVASNATQTTADVTFTAPTTDGGSAVTGYVVTSVPGGFTATSSGAAAGTVTVSGLTPATSYRFQVAAINANGTSTSSELSNVVTTSLLTAPDITLSSITESATAGSAITGYTITNAGGPVAFYSISPAADNGLSFNANTGALTGTPTAAAIAVAYTITATNGVGTDTVIFTITVAAAPPPPAPPAPSAPPAPPMPAPATLPEPPAAPTNLVADPDLYTSSVAWGSTEVVRGFKLYLDEVLVVTLTGDQLTYDLSNLKKNTKYVLAISAFNAGGDSKAATITFTTDNMVAFAISFSGDSSVISKKQLAKLDAFISTIPNLGTARSTIVGSVKKTPRATSAFDRNLAAARAKIVFKRLSSQGLPAGKSALKVLPASKPLDSERRAMFQVVYDQN